MTQSAADGLGARRARARRLTIACGLLLGAALLAFRATILSESLSALAPIPAAGLLLRAVAADWALVWLLTLIAFWSAGRSRRPGLWARGFVALSVPIAAAGLGNIQSVEMLGGPVTLQWLQFADIFNSTYILGIVLGSLSPHLLALAVLSVAAWTVAVALLARLVAVAQPRLSGGIGSLLMALMPVALLGLVAADNDGLGGRAQNPIAALVVSLVAPAPSQVDLDALAGAEAGLGAGDFAEVLDTVPPLPRPEIPGGAIRNVVIYVMESTRAAYVTGYGQDLGLTPVIASLADRAVKVTDAYAHAPASGYARASIFGGIIPEVRPANIHHLYPDLEIDGLARVLGRRGYRSGYFSTTDNRFQGNGHLVDRTGFDLVSDLYDWGPCRHPLRPRDMVTDDYLDTVNDRCAVDPLLAWVDEAPQRPFLAAVWTGMTHYPYYPGPEPEAFAEDDKKNRYLNGIKVMDRALGDLVAGLEARGLLDTTLLVVVGDHGEAFGEHGQNGHATDIYEENLHVPMYFVHPALAPGTTADRIAGLVDIAPTVADLLGLPPSPDWHGQSLFAPRRSDGVLFFAAWNDLQIGFREGSEKLVINANTGASRLHDLASDPGERVDLAATSPERLAKARSKLARLLKAHDARIAGLLARFGSGTPAPPAGGDLLSLSLGGTWYRDYPRVRVRLDGVEIEEFDVTSALSNATEEIDPALILDSAQDFEITLDPGRCPRRLEIAFLNDDWAGEGFTGDNNIFLRRVVLGGTTYWPWQFEVAPDTSGHGGKDAAFLYREGSIGLNLELSPDCIASDLTAAENR